ncbi:hypothetical protein [Ferrimonas marina]|uniref:Uncharacterized protein n=1 Tax=Ferrimonas marina TaxID=299255 RepID=A0A1M5T942_9GAMM|nr:hypothetical protein [Ferrimonas marina]SHH47295.1 hypothetical protein SAMN02745129_2048 [Ferrimonas marina]
MKHIAKATEVPGASQFVSKAVLEDFCVLMIRGPMLVRGVWLGEDVDLFDALMTAMVDYCGSGGRVQGSSIRALVVTDTPIALSKLQTQIVVDESLSSVGLGMTIGRSDADLYVFATTRPLTEMTPAMKHAYKSVLTMGRRVLLCQRCYDADYCMEVDYRDFARHEGGGALFKPISRIYHASPVPVSKGGQKKYWLSVH